MSCSHTWTQVLRKLALLASTCWAGVLISGCDPDGEPQRDDALDQSQDAAVDIDDSSNEDLMDDAQTDADATSIERMPIGSPCESDLGCERGSVCLNGECGVVGGCTDFESEEYGCLISSNFDAGYASAVECAVDDDCTGSEFGANCIRSVCTSRSPCDDDTDCSPPAEASPHFVAGSIPMATG